MDKAFFGVNGLFFSGWPGVVFLAMIFFSFLSQPLFAAPLTASSPAGLEKTFLSISIPVGTWQSVDLVDAVEAFFPVSRQERGDLYLKGLVCHPDGTSSLKNYTFVNGSIVHSEKPDLPIAKTRFYIFRQGEKEYLALPWLSGDVIIRGNFPCYYVLEKTSSETMPLGDKSPVPLPQKSSKEEERRKIGFTFGPNDELKPYDDVRKADLRAIDPAVIRPLLMTLSFNTKTLWPSEMANQAASMSPQGILEACQNPGLGLRALHAQGITGKGVNVAIIDQPLTPDHPEYVGKIASYQDFNCKSDNSMHGPSVTSLLVGEKCGTAPGARVYYAAAPSWLCDAGKYAEALQWIIQVNRALPKDGKIRAVSVSAAPSGADSPFKSNREKWEEAVKQAEKEGIIVLDCTSHHGFISSSYFDVSAPENPERCKQGFPGRTWHGKSKNLHVPSSPRSLAETYQKNDPSYQFNGRGGLSWSIPYAAGVLALGWQIAPELTGEKMRELLFQSAFRNADGAAFINPPEFINRVRQEMGARK
jgi:hypothetical protein